MRLPRRRNVILFLTAAAILAPLLTAARPDGAEELPLYRITAERLLAGDDIYLPSEHPAPFSYPPFFALPFVPLAWLPLSAARPLLYLLNIVVTGSQFAVLACVLGAAWSGRRRGGSALGAWQRHWGTGAVVVCGMLLLSPMSSKQHFCVLLLPITYCAAHCFFVRRTWLTVGALAVTFLFGTLTAKHLIGRDWGHRVLAAGSLTWITLALLVASALHLCRAQREVGADATGDQDRQEAAPTHA